MPENWQDKIFEFNYNYFKIPLDQKVITGKIKTNEKNDFNYKCNEEPMCDVCDKNYVNLESLVLDKKQYFLILQTCRLLTWRNHTIT